MTRSRARALPGSSSSTRRRSRGILPRLSATLAALALLGAGIVSSAATAASDELTYRLVGDLQSELGCTGGDADGDWLPDCAEGELAASDEAFTETFELPGGSYEFKVLAGDSWDAQAWGRGGETGPDAPNIRLTTAGPAELRFTFDPATGRTAIAPTAEVAAPTAADAPAPVRQPGGDEQLYFVLTDRFANGNPSNDTAGLGDDRLISGFDPTDKGFYHGGDIAGLRERLDYIAGLGTTAIWLTPSFTNRPVQGEGEDASAGYHGYWITDFTQIDPHLGTNAELAAFIDEAHAQGIKVYFDIITNHTADVIDYVEGPAENYAYRPLGSDPYTPVVPEGLEDVKAPAWLNDTARYNNRGNTTWEGESAIYGDFDGLDDLDTRQPEVVQGFVDIYEAWVDLGIDGFRIDTVKHVDFSFWEAWTAAIAEYTSGNPEFFMFGEVYDADPVKLAPYVRDTDMDSVLDFTYQAAASSYAQGGAARSLELLFAGDDRYLTATTSAHALPTFLGNHDMGRIGYFVKDASDRLARSELAHSLMYLTRGQPVVYYGDEQGFVGDSGSGNDKDARQSLFASQVAEYRNQNLLDGSPATGDHYGTDGALYRHIAELADLRSAHPALSDGAQVEQYVEQGAGIYAFSRVDGAAETPHEYVVAVNNATGPRTAELTALTPGATFAPLYGDAAEVTSGADGELTVSVPALSAVVLRATTPIVPDAGSLEPAFVSPTPGAGLAGASELRVDLGTERYAETSFAYRVVGADAWTPLGTTDTGSPRIFSGVDDLAPGTLVEYRAVVRDAGDGLTQATTFASVGDDHGAGMPPETDPSSRLTVPGSHGPALGCGEWQPGCFDAELLPREDGIYTGTFDVTAGTYAYKYAFGGDWENNYGVSGVHNSPEDNYVYTHAGGDLTFFFDPVTKLGANTAGGPVITLAGTFQDQLGCAGNWSGACLAGQATRGEDGSYTFATDALEPGTYEAKAIANLDWDTSYGDADGRNVSFTVSEGQAVTFTVDPAVGVLAVTVGEGGGGTEPGPGYSEPAPVRDVTVSIAGTLGPYLGCGPWDATCVDAELTEKVGSVYSRTFALPAGEHEYKVVIGHSWSENYGADRDQDGANIAFTLAEDADVTFVYDDDSRFVSHFFPWSDQGRLAVAAGTLQPELGCASDWAPDCLATWLQSFERDGLVYQYETNRLRAGTYAVKAAFDLGWAEAYPVSDVEFTVPTDWAPMIFRFDTQTQELTITTDDSVPGAGQRAHWLDARTLALPTSALPAPAPPEVSAEAAGAGVRALAADAQGRTWTLHGAPIGGMSVEDGAVTGGDAEVALTLDADGLDEALRTRFPHLAGHLALRLPEDVGRAQLEELLTGQLLLTQQGPGGAVEYATGVQLAGVLDDVFAAAAASERDLGVTWAGDVPALALWAPTAKSVTTLVWPDGGGRGEGAEVRVPAQRQPDGTWVTPGVAAWKDKAYRYDVEVYVPSTGRVEHNVVTDPYSVGLTLDSTHSVLVDLADQAYRPAVWREASAPVVERAVDRAVYELHIRDFSITDSSVPETERGTYLAFAGDGDGVRHLRSLAEAGLNTVHLLPSFDIATIPEDRADQKSPGDLSGFGPAATDQQAAVAAIADEDGFNWGYDPLHYTTPEGSYASTGNQDGGARVAEFRTMVGGLHDLGLQVVLDVVYNHTAAHGQAATSVLDRVVPGYYQRLNATGGVESSTCCSNTATENTMMEKLMVDSVVTWAREYRVDGFRFDLMGHHSKANMLAVRAALDELTLERDGVDGSAIYLYGEGWDFGEVAGNARFEQATQGQLGGTGIGTFSDRLRDAVHGGTPVDGNTVFQQGFGTGLGTDPNGREASLGDPGTVNDGSDGELADLAHQTDLVRLGLAGNLRAYTFETSSGTVQRGDELDYRGSPAGYADQPGEVVTYVDAHDNETLFDLLTLKLPEDTSMADRVRMNTLSLATVALAQTPAFWHAGTDLLRSKSLDRDSYNSGDHFNRIDWTGQTSTFGVGLPPADKNQDTWPIMAPLLENDALRPTAADMAAASAAAQDLLRMRYSTPLLRLGNAELIEQKVTFPGSGADATPGLLLMHIDDRVGGDVDPALDGALIAFNASPDPIATTVEGLAGRTYALSPAQAAGADVVVKETSWAADGTLTIPARTVALLVEAQDPGTDGPGTGGPGTGEPGTGDPDGTQDPGPGNGQAGDRDLDGTGTLPRSGINAGLLVAIVAALLIAGTALVASRRTQEE